MFLVDIHRRMMNKFNLVVSEHHKVIIVELSPFLKEYHLPHLIHTIIADVLALS